jgi:glycerol uptake facilitator-like aquaporin
MDSSVDMRPERPLDASLEPPLERYGPARRLAAEALGTALLLAVVVGSGIMGERLAGGNAAIALLGNTLATGAALVVLITVFGPISGAHFNPVVTAMFAAKRELSWRLALGYIAVQVVAAVLGVWMAHLMFGEPLLQVSTKARDGLSQGFAEAVATFGLVATILGSLRFKPDATPMLVGLYITAAYWFTASTSFANPAVTVARSLSNTFAGIAPHSAPLFIAGQLAGGVVGAVAFNWLLSRSASFPRGGGDPFGR